MPMLVKACAEFTQTASAKGLFLRLVPTESGTEPNAFFDEKWTLEALCNLLDNAVKYSPPGGTIRIEVLTDGANAFVSIADEGPGIAPDDLENVKQKFFKGKGAVRGSGIGLAVVDEIVTAHGGGVEIQSEQGHGTTAIVRLPLYTQKKAGSAG